MTLHPPLLAITEEPAIGPQPALPLLCPLLPYHVTKFHDRMSAKYGSIVLDRNVRDVMERARAFLEKLGVPLDQETFLQRYAFTLGKFIWYPFNIDNPVPTPFWPTLGGQLIGVAHEHVHVRQGDESGLAPFATDYALSSEARATRWEADGYTTSLELGPTLLGYEPDPGVLAKNLGAYGCTDGDIEATRIILTSRQDVVRQGGVITPESREVFSFLREEGLIP